MLLDVVMPRLGGLEVLQRLRDLEPHLPILLTTGYSPDAARGSRDNDPNLRVLPKPYAPEALLEAIHALLSPARG